jgi:hypothetical protein
MLKLFTALLFSLFMFGVDGVAYASGYDRYEPMPGPQGERGPRGKTGSQGPVGETGATGSTGAVGAVGASGATGSSGSDGTDGADGATGSRGYAGLDGTDAYVDDNDYQSMGAMALAGANIHFNPDSDKWQAGIGVGQFEGVTGGAVSIGKKLFGNGPLLSLSGNTNTHSGSGVGAGLTFGF